MNVEKMNKLKNIWFDDFYKAESHLKNYIEKNNKITFVQYNKSINIIKYISASKMTVIHFIFKNIIVMTLIK